MNVGESEIAGQFFDIFFGIFDGSFDGCINSFFGDDNPAHEV